MTEYETLDLLISTSLAGVEAFGMYITVLAAYLVASYIAAEKLSNGQLVTISVLYVIAAAVTSWTTHVYLARSISLGSALLEINPNAVVGVTPLLQNTVAFIQFSGIVSSLFFTISLRRSKKG
jgi:hypothetical protein